MYCYGEHGRSYTDIEAHTKDVPDESCFISPGINPVIENRIKGALYCGKRGGASFEKAVRPIVVDQ